MIEKEVCLTSMAESGGRLSPASATAVAAGSALLGDTLGVDLSQQRAEEIAWLATHPDRFAELAGQWVAIDGKELLGHARFLSAAHTCFRSHIPLSASGVKNLCAAAAATGSRATS